MSLNPLKWWQRIKEANALINKAREVPWPRECFIDKTRLLPSEDGDERIRVCGGDVQHVYRRDKNGRIISPVQDNFPKYEHRPGETI